MPVEIVQEGRTYVWTRRGIPYEGEYYIAETGAFCRWGGGYVIQGSWYDVFALKPVRHTLGKPGERITFEETGERRDLQRGEWYLSDAGVVSLWLDERRTGRSFIILRPVAIEGQP